MKIPSYKSRISSGIIFGLLSNKILTILYVLTKTKIAVQNAAEVNEKPIAILERGSFIAEISFLTGEPASADVHAKGEVIFISWKSDRLKNLQHENSSFWMKLQHALSEDLIRKVKPQAKRESQIEDD